MSNENQDSKPETGSAKILVQRLVMQDFSNGMTVRELKRMVAALPEQDEDGGNFEVWMRTGDGVSSPIANVSPLNRGDVLLGCRQWPA